MLLYPSHLGCRQRSYNNMKTYILYIGTLLDIYLPPTALSRVRQCGVRRYVNFHILGIRVYSIGSCWVLMIISYYAYCMV